MRIVHAVHDGVIPIGRIGENEATAVVFDVSCYRELFGEGAFTLYVERPTDERAYEQDITVDGETVTWIVQNEDVAYPGYGKCELTYTVGDTVAKAEVFTTYASESLPGGAEVPQKWDTWADHLIAVGEAAEEAKEAAEAAQHAAEDVSLYPAYIGDNGNWYTWVDGEYVDSGVRSFGKSAYETAQEGGYPGTEAQFEDDLAKSPRRWAEYDVTTAEQIAEWYHAGYSVLCVRNSYIHYLMSVYENSSGTIECYFTNLDENRVRWLYAVRGPAGSGWESGNFGWSSFMKRANPVCTGSFSLNRASDSEIGEHSFASGYDAEATGENSHAMGYNVEAKGDNQFVIGKFNRRQGQDYNEFAFVIGGGSSRSMGVNIETTDWQGNKRMSGDVYVHSGSGVGGKKLLTEDDVHIPVCMIVNVGTSAEPRWTYVYGNYATAQMLGLVTLILSSPETGTRHYYCNSDMTSTDDGMRFVFYDHSGTVAKTLILNSDGTIEEE